MKVMYVASNPQDAGTLRIEQEINELQARFSAVNGEPVTFLAFPSLAFEQLPLELSRIRPDILHISAHGNDATASLALSNQAGAPVHLTGEALVAFLRIDKPPRLLYLNACDSEEIAEKAIAVVPFAIGTTAPISNRTARASAVVFYDRILGGSTVGDSFIAAQEALSGMQSGAAKSVLRQAPGADAGTERLYMVPRLVARFTSNPGAVRNGSYEIETGVLGSPGNTSQLVIFTDDKSFIKFDEMDDEDDEFEVASYLCQVIQDSPVRTAMWGSRSWLIYGDFRLYASAVTAAGDIVSIGSTACEALEWFYRLTSPGTPLPATVAAALSALRSEDGSGLTAPKTNKARKK